MSFSFFTFGCGDLWRLKVPFYSLLWYCLSKFCHGSRGPKANTCAWDTVPEPAVVFHVRSSPQPLCLYKVIVVWATAGAEIAKPSISLRDLNGLWELVMGWRSLVQILIRLVVFESCWCLVPQAVWSEGVITLCPHRLVLVFASHPPAFALLLSLRGRNWYILPLFPCGFPVSFLPPNTNWCPNK